MFVKYHWCINVNFISLCLYCISYSSKNICYSICPCEQFDWTVSQLSGRKNPSKQLFRVCLVWEGQSACVRTELWVLARGSYSVVNGWMDVRGNSRLNEAVIRRLLCFNWLLLHMQTSCPIKIIFLSDLGYKSVQQLNKHLWIPGSQGTGGYRVFCWTETVSTGTIDKKSHYTVNISINSHEDMHQGSVGIIICIASKPEIQKVKLFWQLSACFSQ